MQAVPVANILLVDDNAANLLALEEVLKPLGQRLVSVRSADDALRRLLHEDFAVVLMDVRMPEMDGFEAAQLIRQRQVIPIIFLTGWASSPEEILRGYEVGGVDYLTKPYQPLVVRNKVSVFVELWRAKEELRQSILSVAERDLDLAEKRKDAEAREQFIGILGHDLRTPLTAISMAADAMMDPDAPIAPRVIAGHIKRSAQRMERMIRDVLDFARGRLGGGIPVSLGAVDLYQLCQQVVEEVRVAHPQHAISFESSATSAMCACDPDRTAQVISNLVGNAVQHGEDPIMVRLRDEDDCLAIEVSNRGAPIPPEIRERIFSPFVGKKRANSLGLGLYIACEIVRAHDGDLRLASSEEGVTTFTVILPRSGSYARPTTSAL